MIYNICGIHRDEKPINGGDPDSAIDAYFFRHDGVLYYLMREDMVRELDNGNVAYAVRAGYPDALCFVYTSLKGVRYLKSISDGIPGNNLSELPEYNY